MLGRETKLGARLECLAGLSGRAGASNEVEFPREIPAQVSTSCFYPGVTYFRRLGYRSYAK